MINVKLRGIAEGRLGKGSILSSGSTVSEIVKDVAFKDDDLKHNLFDERTNKPRLLCRVLVNGKLATVAQPVNPNDEVMLASVVTCDG
ncbi:MAG: MoaD/ThiS family protein [Lactococcus raffinolactis]|nr:MoaD/ThiS family protein [Acinetobacter sp.]MDN6044297.1 MoaD/ThiS family protein [Lactococcus raffinolactis]MDN6044304.1 MoaD/ThiS family protein [Lactococcus raffinolactis]MDN6119231.1 MoaD/ThiS family protein [Lactococcus sp.]MDN6525117.1 MoaD/ThiS family protein [Lactococcus sp.]